MQDAYRDDLAHVHDAGFGDLARAAAPVLLNALRRAGHARGLVVDLGCGSGILAGAVSDAGYDVLGIDLSAAMLAIARRRAPRARFRRESLYTAGIPRCVAVAAVGEAFNYLFDRAGTKQGLARLLRRIRAALEPGGLVLCDVAGPGRVPGRGVRRNFFEGDGWAVLVEAEEDRQRRILTRRITSFRKVGQFYRRDREIHRQRLVPSGELAAQLRAAGFRVRTLRRYGRVRFPRGLAAFVGRKA